ncbi:MAG: branched-chain amino acid transport system ATP-binding protein [Clostridia bacterium]|nr:branched-chain amino acid transport system ATP-binding protein [Clostridia bacterium]
MLLEVNQVQMYFGGIKALDGVDVAIQPGTIHAVIGPNGSGKTTMFNVITGFYKPTSGKIHFNGIDITGEKPHFIVEKGMARTFQTLRLFPHMTVMENVVVGRHTRIRESFWRAAIRSRSTIKEEKGAYEKAEQVLDLVGLIDKRHQLANSLAYGEARLLEIARALASDPQLLLLDEPAAGMNPSETKQVMELVKQLCQKGLTIILVEHDMKAVMAYSDVVTVLDHGKKLAEGTPEEIQHNEHVISAYLGKRRGQQHA